MVEVGISAKKTIPICTTHIPKMSGAPSKKIKQETSSAHGVEITYLNTTSIQNITRNMET